MFDVSWSALVVVGAVALIGVGAMLRPVFGRAADQCRRLTSDFIDDFVEAMRPRS
jgi:hypothetical protein